MALLYCQVLEDFRPGCGAEGHFGGAGDAVFLFGGQEVGDDVVGVGGVEEAGGGEVGGEEAEQREEGCGDGVMGREGVDGGEFEGERGEAEGVAATPDFEGQDVAAEAAGADVTNLLFDVGLNPGVEAELPKGVVGGVEAAAGGDEIDIGIVEGDADRDIAGLGEEVAEAGGQRAVPRGEGWRGGGGEAKEQVQVAVAEGGAFGLGTGNGDGFEEGAGPGVEEGQELAAEAVGGGVGVFGKGVAVDDG